jgi:hypothetical protein
MGIFVISFLAIAAGPVWPNGDKKLPVGDGGDRAG